MCEQPPMAMSKLQQVADGKLGWADLPPDLLESVVGRLPLPDRLRFPAVCTTWQQSSAAAAARRHQYQTTLPPSPWLMLPFNPIAAVVRRRRKRNSDDTKLARFLSLADGRVYVIRQPAPAVSDRLCVGSSSDGWLVTADDASELQLLNPVTGAQVRLPSVTTLPYVHTASRDAEGRVVSYSLILRCCCDGDDDEAAIPPETFAADRLRYEIYEKAIFVSAPRRTTSSSGSSSWSSWGDYAVLLICQPLSRLAVARAGDTKWTMLDTPGRCWVDAVRAAGGTQHQQRRVVYAMDTAGRVDVWDMDAAAKPTLLSMVAPPCRCGCSSCSSMSAACRKYLVELSPGGRLLQVHRLRDAAHARYTWEPRPERVEYTTAEVELFEWNKSDGQQWARVDCKSGVLAGRALFLGKSASLCVPGADDGQGLRGNCVYFSDDGPWWSHERCREVAPDVGVLDLSDGTYRPPRGAVRDLLWKWPPPVWVFPSLAN